MLSCGIITNVFGLFVKPIEGVRMKSVIFILACVLLAIPCWAKIITVDDDGPADFNNIQEAISDANDGDIIEVQPGTYTGDGNRDIDFDGRAITVRSTDPNDFNIVAATIIDCNGTGSEYHRGFYFHNGEGPNSVLAGLTITNGFAWLGGGVFCYGSSPTIRNCIITGNSAYEGGGGMFNDLSSPMLAKCTFSGNSAVEAGGGMTNYRRSSPLLTNCIFSDNSASYGGGAITNSDSSNAKLTNCTIMANSAGYNGGGGGLLNVSSSPVLGNCTFSRNLAGRGNAIMNMWADTSPTLTNSVLWDGGDEIENKFSSTITITYSDVQGGWPGLGNIDVDPCFVDPGYWNANGTPSDVNDDFWVDGDYHLKSEGWRWDSDANQWTWDNITSRCIDAGNPGSSLGNEPITLDVDPLNRFGQNLRVNMGAYGGTAEGSMPPYDWAILADITNDGTVDFADFAYLAAIFTDQDDQLPGDFDRDGDVDFSDVALLIADWLKETTWHEP